MPNYDTINKINLKSSLHLEKPTLDWPVDLSFAKYIRAMVPKGLNNSCKSESLTSSERLVTLTVAVSSERK